MRGTAWSIVQLAAFAACASLPAGDSIGQTYPVKPIRIVVGFVAGGAVDFTARQVAQKLSESLGQPVIVENRPGAGSSIGTERVAASPPDGYTLLLMATSGVVQAALRTNLPYNLERDLAPVSLVASGPFVLAVHPSVPARNVRELIVLARAQPGKLNTASPGVGTSNHLAGELFNLSARVNIVHVPYKGGAESTVAAAAGEVAMTFAAVAVALPLLNVGKLRPLGITSARRASLLPLIPTLDEAGVAGYDYSVWYGMLAPAPVPKEIIARLNAAVGKAVQTADMREALSRQGLEPTATTPQQFAARIRSDLAQTTRLIKLTGLKAE